jgi:hypothetical protein
LPEWGGRHVFRLAYTINQGLSGTSYGLPPDNTSRRGSGVLVQLIKTHGMKCGRRKTAWGTNRGADKEAEENKCATFTRQAKSEAFCTQFRLADQVYDRGIQRRKA